jgi:hypothetical protein
VSPGGPGLDPLCALPRQWAPDAAEERVARTAGSRTLAQQPAPWLEMATLPRLDREPTGKPSWTTSALISNAQPQACPAAPQVPVAGHG